MSKGPFSLLCVLEIVNPTNEQENGNSSGYGTELLVVVVKISLVFVWGRATIFLLYEACNTAWHVTNG